MRRRCIVMWMCGLCMALVLTWALQTPQGGEHMHMAREGGQDQPKAPVRITSEELHARGGIPPGWQFSFPVGDPSIGRGVFEKLECYQCHAIQRETFPQSSTPAGQGGPEMTGMGDHHSAEYFAESILNPNAVIVMGPGYTDANGMSIMPDYRNSLSVAELIDLVTYLKSLKGEHEPQAGPDMLLDKVVGDYRIRLSYHKAKAAAQEHGMQSHESHTHGSQGSGMAHPSPRDHLMAVITDAKTGEPVPYLPVTARILSPKHSPRPLKLIPMGGDTGFHYGADVTLPTQPAKVTLSVGPTTMRMMSNTAGRFATAQVVSLDWSPQQSSETGSEGRPSAHKGHGMHDGAKDR